MLVDRILETNEFSGSFFSNIFENFKLEYIKILLVYNI